MHIYLATRGIKQNTDIFLEELSWAKLPFKCRMKDGKPDMDGEITDSITQVAVRPIQLHEIVFPKEHKDVMLTTLFGQPGGKYSGKPNHAKFQKWVDKLRWVLGIEPRPETWDGKNRLMVKPPEAIEMICVGIKDDLMEGETEQL